jgi:hypothetical protein
MQCSQAVLLSCISLAGVSGCVDSQVACSPTIPAAVAVVVRDSVTDSLVVDSAKGIVVGMGIADSLFRGPALQFGDSVLMGGRQVGRVYIQIDRPGFQQWVATRVQTRLSGGECPSFITTVLTARMQR